jgi:hypothetical protein
MDGMHYMDDITFALWLLWGQTDEDRAAIAQWRADCEAVGREQERARVIAETDTVRERTP